MIEQEITLLTNGRISFQKCGNGLQFGYSKNRGVYSIKVKTSGEWNGLTIRAFWHIPDIKEPITSLLVDNVIRVPALVTSYKGEGRIVFEGSDGAKTVTSADVRYYVNKNSGTCDGTIPEPGTPAWQELVGTVKKYSDTAVEAKESAKKSADEAKQALEDTKDVKSQAIEEINSSKTAVIEEIENKKNLSIEEINSVKEDAKGELEALCDSTRDFANQAKEAADRAKASELAAKGSEDKAKTSEIISTANTAEVAKNLETVRDIKAEIDILDANVSANAASSNENANNARVSAEVAKQSETNVALSEASALESKNASAENAAKSQNNASNAKNSADSAKESETKAQEYSNLSQSNANASSESASNAKASEDASKKNADDSAATLQELKDGIASGDFKGDKGDPGPAGKDAPQIDDTAVTDSAPWSSKHIVDVLCPPLEETGNPVQCYPVAGYPLGCKVSWKPTQEGSGDPSPDNVRPIKGRDSVTVERCGENLLDAARIFPDIKIYDGVTFTNNKDGTITVDGITTRTSYFDSLNTFFLPAGNYTICATPNTRMSVLRESDRAVLAASQVGGFKAFTLAKNEICECFIACDGTFSNEVIRPCIVQGAVDTGWTQFHGDIYDLTMPHTIYGGTVDAVTGEGQEAWKLLTLDGTEDWRYESNSYFVGHSILSNLPTEIDGKCSHFIYSFNFAGNCIFCTVDSVYTGPKLTEKYTGLDEWKSYLAAQYAAGTPVQIAYKLAEPVPFTATGAQPIPALSGINTALTDADSATVTGRADPIKRITDLEDAVASMTDT